MKQPARPLKDIILSLLWNGPLNTAFIIEKIHKQRSSISKQGIYKALRKLSHEEVIILHKHIASLNIIWISKMSDRLLSAQRAYLKNNNQAIGHFTSLKDGEKIRYDFRDAETTDTFWVHALHILIEFHPGMTWFGYNPHCWFFIVRRDSERQLQKFIREKGGIYAMTVSGKTMLDRYIAKEFDGRYSKYHMRDKPLFPQNNYYVNIIGDFIIEVWMDPAIENRIRKIYQTSSTYSEDVDHALREAIATKGKSKLIISRNHKKALMLTKKLSKPFYFVKKPS